MSVDARAALGDKIRILSGFIFFISFSIFCLALGIPKSRNIPPFSDNGICLVASFLLLVRICVSWFCFSSAVLSFWTKMFPPPSLQRSIIIAIFIFSRFLYVFWIFQ